MLEARRHGPGVFVRKYLYAWGRGEENGVEGEGDGGWAGGGDSLREALPNP